MRDRLSRAIDSNGVKPPYHHLYIYHIEGRVAPTYEPAGSDFIGLWQETDSAFLFFSNPVPKTIAELMRRHSDLTYHDCYHLTYDQWHGGRFEPFRQGQLSVVPAWHDADGAHDPPEASKPILLDPGVVFGMGTHPTTRDCLAALQQAFQSAGPMAALDLGTGTGLLALAAVRLGSRRVVAVDMNALATKTALSNVRLNRMQDYVMVIQANAMEVVDFRADMVIANIHYDVMRRLIHSKAFLGKKHFVLSGLMRREAKDITGELRRRSIDIIQQWQHEGTWFTFYARRRS